MKIVYISNSIIPSRTANSIHVMKMCQAFADNGHEVVLLAPDRYKEYENGVDDVYEYYGVRKNFEIKKLKYGNIRYLKTIMYGYNSAKRIRELQPDLVYGRDLLGCFFSANDFSTIFEAHSPMHSKINKKIFNMLHSKIRYKKTVVISKALKNIILAEQHISENKIQVAHDGADEVNSFDTKIILKGDVNSLKVGYVGHLYKGRGIDIIIKCATKLPKITFHIVGGRNEDIEFWKNSIKILQLRNIYFYGFISPQQAVLYRNAFDIVLAPYAKVVSVADGIVDTSRFMSPLKIFEYMAHKKAIISSDIDVLHEVLNPSNSILVEAQDANSWVNAIEKLSNSNMRNFIAKNAYDDFLQKYTWKNRAENVIK